MNIRQEDLAGYDTRYRATLINSLAGVRQAFLIGTRSADGFSNLAVFNSLIHIGAHPPLWGFICRPDTVKRDTLANIRATGEYTINYAAAVDYEKVHQTSAKYPKETSEFAACGFTESYREGCAAPFVAEAVVKIALKFEQQIDIPLNGTMLIIGSLQHIELDDDLVSPDGFVALDKANTLACAGLDAYYETAMIGRLSYAREGEWPVEIG